MLLNERVAGVASRGTARLAFLFRSRSIQKVLPLFHFLCFIIDLRFLCSSVWFWFSFSKPISKQFCFVYFRSFTVCWTAPCSFLRYRTQKIRHLYTDITWRHTKVSQYCSFDSFKYLTQSIWLTFLPRNGVSCIFRHCVFFYTHPLPRLAETSLYIYIGGMNGLHSWYIYSFALLFANSPTRLLLFQMRLSSLVVVHKSSPTESQ